MVSKIHTSKNQTLPSQWVGLAVGVSPNIDFLKGSGLNLGKGILVNRYLETSQADVFAI